MERKHENLTSFYTLCAGRFNKTCCWRGKITWPNVFLSNPKLCKRCHHWNSATAFSVFSRFDRLSCPAADQAPIGQHAIKKRKRKKEVNLSSLNANATFMFFFLHWNFYKIAKYIPQSVWFSQQIDQFIFSIVMDNLGFYFVILLFIIQFQTSGLLLYLQ